MDGKCFHSFGSIPFIIEMALLYASIFEVGSVSILDQIVLYEGKEVEKKKVTACYIL